MPTYVRAPARLTEFQIEQLPIRTPLTPLQRSVFEAVIALMPDRVQSTLAEDGCRWLSWPNPMNDVGDRHAQVRLLVDAKGDWHRLELSLPVQGRDIKTRIQFGTRRSNKQWLEVERTQEAILEATGRPLTASSITLLASWEGEAARVDVDLLKDVDQRPLVALLTSMAERGVEVQTALDRLRPPDTANTVATLPSLGRTQLLAVVGAVADDKGKVQLDLSDLRHLSGKVSGRVLMQLTDAKELLLARILMGIVRTHSEPMGDTSWGTHYSGGSTRAKAYEYRYRLTRFLADVYAKECPGVEALAGARASLRYLEDELAPSEPMTWQLIEELAACTATTLTSRFTKKGAEFFAYLKASLHLLEKQLQEPVIEVPPGPLLDDVEAYRLELEAGLPAELAAAPGMHPKVYLYSKFAAGLGNAWGRDEPMPDLRYQNFTSQVFRQHDAELALGDTSQCLHHFLELPKAVQHRLVARWAGDERLAFEMGSVLDARYELGLAAPNPAAATTLQVDRDMLADTRTWSNPPDPRRLLPLFEASGARRPADPSLLMTLAAQPHLIAVLDAECERRNILKGPLADRVRTVREVVAEHYGLSEPFLDVQGRFTRLPGAWYHEPYDPLWIDASATHPAQGAPKRPKIPGHVDLAGAVLATVRDKVVRTASDEDDVNASRQYVDARDAVVEWLNFVESQMWNTSYHAELRLEVLPLSKAAFIAQVCTDLRASAGVVEDLAPPRLLGDPFIAHIDPSEAAADDLEAARDRVVATPERSARISQIATRRTRFAERLRDLADDLENDEDGMVRFALDSLHDIVLPDPAPRTSTSDGS